MLENILLIIAGFFLLIKGAGILVDGSSQIAKKINISQIIIGLTIVAIGTSLPELIVCLKSAIIKEPDVSVGIVIGSNIFNLFFVLGLCSIIAPIKYKKEIKIIDIPISLVMIFTLFILCNNSGIEKILTRPEGVVLIILFFCFFSYTIFSAKYGEIIEPKVQLISNEEDVGILKSIVFIIIGIIALNFGGDFVVDNITEIIKKFNADGKVLSLTILAIGTSLPELITSITAVLKKEDEIAIGNILGSNIFNFLLILGLSSVISPIRYSVEYNLDMMIFFIGTALVLVFPFIGKKNYISKINGILLLIIYIAYIISLLVR